jgi:hypothetical protein
MRARAAAGAWAAAWLAALAAGATPAEAAQVYVVATAGSDATKGGTPPVSGLAVAAAPGEANHLTFTAPGASIVVRDPSAPLVPGAGCAVTAPGEVTCASAMAPLTAISVDAGDGDDVVDASAVRALLTVDGGAGNDVLRGGTASDRFRPGTGDDEVDATAGGAVLYDERRAPVTIALDGSAPSGEASEHDVLRGLTQAAGGSGDDTIVGSDHGEVLDGGAGDDTIRAAGGDDDLDGRGGDDTLLGGDGRDVLDGEAGRDDLVGGAGDDVLFGAGSADRLDGGDGDDRLDLSGDSATALREFASCGDGRDLAATPDGLEAISTDCERVSIGVPDVDLQPVVVALPLRRTARATYARLWCDARDGGDRCVARVTVRRRNGAPALRGTKTMRPSFAPRTLVLHGGRLRPHEAVWVSVRGTQTEDGDRLPLHGGFKVVVG